MPAIASSHLMCGFQNRAVPPHTVTVLKGIHLCIRLLDSPGSRFTFAALLFGRRGRFLTTLVNIL